MSLKPKPQCSVCWSTNIRQDPIPNYHGGTGLHIECMDCGIYRTYRPSELADRPQYEVTIVKGRKRKRRKK